VFWAVATTFASGAVVLALAAGAGATAHAAAQDDHPQLPKGNGREVMIRVCSTCHEPELAAGQQNDKAGWKDLVDQMASRGADATEPEFAQIVDYLAASFPPAK
jgi:cytochrome c5